MFDGTLGNHTDTEYKIELLEGAKPYHAKPFPILKVHEETLKTEFIKLVNIGVLKPENHSQWAVHTLIIPTKNKTVHFVFEIRDINKGIKSKPFPIPKIQDLLLKIEGFKCASLLLTGVSPKLIKYHASYLIGSDDVHTRN